MTQRYVRRNRRIDDYSGCCMCGTCWGAAIGAAKQGAMCAPSTCMACGSRQCQGNGLSNGRCSVCYVGLLPGWSGNDGYCQYKGCSHKAVACDGKWYVCAEHLERRKPGYVAAQLSQRDKGWTLVDELMSGTARVA